jgi:hypothetical protein
MPEGPSAEAVQQVWTTTLVIFAVVLGVVALLLTLVVREARRIRAGVSEIWNVGQGIANNTVHIALLQKTNHVAGEILHSAVGVVGATAAVRSHAEECPSCPACVLGPRWLQ